MSRVLPRRNHVPRGGDEVPRAFDHVLFADGRTRRSLHERGAALTLAGLSPTVADALAVFGLDPQLDAVGPLTGAQA